MFKSIPFTPRKVEATEARLQAIYDAAALGLKGDSLALAAGMLPTEFRQLCELDPAADMAMLKGRADSEIEASAHLRERPVLATVRQRWLSCSTSTAGQRQEISVDITNKISITQALQQAQERVLDGRTIEGLITEQQPERLTTKVTHGATADL
jgi:hypothetical protein